jgi:hypothetical protein
VEFNGDVLNGGDNGVERRFVDAGETSGFC